MATGQDIIDEVRIQLHDLGVDIQRWPDGELLRYLNAAARQTVLVKPEAYVVEQVVDTTDDLKQILPGGGIKFLGAWNTPT